MLQAVGVGLLLLPGCDVARSARSDLASLIAPAPSPASRKTAPAQAAKGSPAQGTATSAAETAAKSSPALDLTGIGQDRLLAALGPPTSEKDHPPGKQWQYRDGKCTLDVQLYPDVQTKQFSTLAYKVKSDDNTDEGQRLCLARLQSRLQARSR